MTNRNGVNAKQWANLAFEKIIAFMNGFTQFQVIKNVFGQT